MPANKDLSAKQKRRLFMLMKLQKADESEREKVLNELILETETEMDARDVAYVEMKIKELSN